MCGHTICLNYTLYPCSIEDWSNLPPEMTRESQTWKICQEKSQIHSLIITEFTPTIEPASYWKVFLLVSLIPTSHFPFLINLILLLNICLWIPYKIIEYNYMPVEVNLAYKTADPSLPPGTCTQRHTHTHRLEQTLAWFLTAPGHIPRMSPVLAPSPHPDC